MIHKLAVYMTSTWPYTFLCLILVTCPLACLLCHADIKNEICSMEFRFLECFNHTVERFFYCHIQFFKYLRNCQTKVPGLFVRVLLFDVWVNFCHVLSQAEKHVFYHKNVFAIWLTEKNTLHALYYTIWVLYSEGRSNKLQLIQHFAVKVYYIY